MRGMLLLFCLLIPAQAQWTSLATNRDASQIYFVSTLLQTGSPQPAWGKLFIDLLPENRTKANMIWAIELELKRRGRQRSLIFLGGPWGYCERSSDGTRRTQLFPAHISQAGVYESQTDLLALGYLVDAGFDPQALNKVFERWNGKLRPDAKLFI